MKRKLVASSILNIPISSDERARIRNERRLMMELGLLPIGYTQSGVDNQQQTKSKRFSSLYATENEFLSDKIKALDMISETGNVTQEIYDKITNTLKELEPIYGDKYRYMY